MRLQPEKISTLGDAPGILEKWVCREGGTVGRDSTEPRRKKNSVNIKNTASGIITNIFPRCAWETVILYVIMIDRVRASV